MTDYSAHDIHQLDQAYPDALADIERFTGNPANKNRLAEVGPEVYAAELTRDLAYSTDNPMSLAGWAAIATVRLMDAGKAWEDDTDMAWAKVDQANAQRDEYAQDNNRLRARVADLADKLHKAQQDNASLTKAATTWANETAAKDKVIEAAEAWCEFPTDEGSTGQALRAAVDALPKKAEVA